MKLIRALSLSIAVSIIGVIAGTLVFHFVLAAAFVEPTKEPPLGNVPGPIWNTTAKQADSNFNISGDGVIGQDLTVNNEITAGYATIKKQLTLTPPDGAICLGGNCRITWPEGGTGTGSQNLQQVTDLGNFTTKPLLIDTDGNEITSIGGYLSVAGAPVEYSGLYAGIAAKGTGAGGYFQSTQVDDSGNPLGSATLGTSGVGVTAIGRGSGGTGVSASGTNVGIYGASSNIAGYFTNGTAGAILGYGGYAGYFSGTIFSYGDFIINKTNKIKSQGDIILQLDYDQATSNDTGAKFKITDASGTEKFSVDELGTLGIYGALAVKDLIIEPKSVFNNPYLLIGLTGDAAGSERILKLRHRREVIDSPVTDMKASLDLDGNLIVGGNSNVGNLTVSGSTNIRELTVDKIIVNGDGTNYSLFKDSPLAYIHGGGIFDYFLLNDCFIKTYNCGGNGCDRTTVKSLAEICATPGYTSISVSCEDLKESVGETTIFLDQTLPKPFWCAETDGIDLTVTCCKITL